MKYKTIFFLILVVSLSSCASGNVSWDENGNLNIDGNIYYYEDELSSGWNLEGSQIEVGYTFSFHGKTTFFKSELDNNVNVIENERSFLYFKQDFVFPDIFKTNIISFTIGEHYSPEKPRGFEKKYNFKDHFGSVALNDIMVPFLEDLTINSNTVSETYFVYVIYENYEYLKYTAIDLYVINDVYYFENVYTEDKYIITEKYVHLFDCILP